MINNLMKGIVLAIATTGPIMLNGQVKLDQHSGDNYFQIGNEIYTPLTIGYENAAPLNAPWSIEYWDNGLNFWKPFPSTNNGNYKLFIGDDGLVGIGKKPDTGDKLQVNGNIRSTANLYAATGNFPTVNTTTVNATGVSDFDWIYTNHLVVNGQYITSDEKLKSNIVDIDNALDKLLKLHGKSYDKKNNFVNNVDSTKPKPSSQKRTKNNDSSYGEIKEETIKSDNSKSDEVAIVSEPETSPESGYDNKELGLMAQEVKAIFPELVKEDRDGILAVNYVALIPVLIEALREQDEKISVLEALNRGQQSQRRMGSPTGQVNSSANAAIEPLAIESQVIGGASLEQNKPNPFDQSTDIKFSIPTNAETAYIIVYDLNGTQKKSYQLSQRGEGSITIDASELKPAMYLYTLLVDQKEIDTKRMILTDY